MRTAVKAIILLIALLAPASLTARNRVIDQLWQFTPDPKAQFTATTVDREAKWRPAQASLSWNAQFDDLRDYAGVGWYRVNIALQPQPSMRQLIHFGAVDYLAEVWVNGKRLGEHEGGYTPFTFDLTGKVHAGNNEILLRVFDPRSNFSPCPHGATTPAAQESPHHPIHLKRDWITTRFLMESRIGMCRPAGYGSRLRWKLYPCGTSHGYTSPRTIAAM